MIDAATENSATRELADRVAHTFTSARIPGEILEALVEALAPRLAEELTGAIAARLRVDAIAGDDLILSRAEAARFLGRSVKTLELWASRGIGPTVTQIGPRACGYRVGDLRNYTHADPARARAVVTKHLAAVSAK